MECIQLHGGLDLGLASFRIRGEESGEGCTLAIARLWLLEVSGGERSVGEEHDAGVLRRPTGTEGKV